MTIFNEHGMITSASLWLPLAILFIGLVVVDWRKQRISFTRLLFEGLLCVYLWGLFEMTLFPINISRSTATLMASGETFQGAIATHPLALWYNWQQPSSLYQIVGNGLMLAPLVLLVGALSVRMRRFRRSLTLAFATSLFIECTQLLMNYFNLGDRTFDINDLILNTCGGLIGWLFLQLGLLIWRRI